MSGGWVFVNIIGEIYQIRVIVLMQLHLIVCLRCLRDIVGVNAVMLCLIRSTKINTIGPKIAKLINSFL